MQHRNACKERFSPCVLRGSNWLSQRQVERSLRVLDGAVVIFDAVAGVEAQSRTVWRQADRFKIPRIVFVNKMDREGASLENTVEMIRQRLKVTPVVLQFPLGVNSTARLRVFEEVVDLIEMNVLRWDEEDGK